MPPLKRPGQANPGKGFAVVASEIRNLAAQSSNFAKQIESIINEIQIESNRSISSIKMPNQPLKTECRLVSKSGEAFKDVFSSIEKIAAEMQEVSSVITHIAHGTANLVSNIESIRRFHKMLFLIRRM